MNTADTMGNQVGEWLTCRECGAAWLYTPSEHAWMQVGGFATPKRCKACRARRRAEGARDTTV